MPTLSQMGLGLGEDEATTLNNLGAAAGTFPMPSVFGAIDRQNAARRQALTGPATTGRMTWFNPRPWSYTDPATGIPWTDAQAQARREGAHASGLPISTPGFATAGRTGLGHWYEVTLPDGRKYVTQKTDIGPPGVVDLNAALASQAYPKGPQSVPGGSVTARYLGANLPEGMTAGSATGGWNTTVGADPSGAGYVNPERVAQGASTNPADLQRPPEGPGFLQNFMRALGSSPWTPAPQVPAIPAAPQAAAFRPALIGRGAVGAIR